MFEPLFIICLCRYAAAAMMMLRHYAMMLERHLMLPRRIPPFRDDADVAILRLFRCHDASLADAAAFSLFLSMPLSALRRQRFFAAFATMPLFRRYAIVHTFSPILPPPDYCFAAPARRV